MRTFVLAHATAMFLVGVVASVHAQAPAGSFASEPDRARSASPAPPSTPASLLLGGVPAGPARDEVLSLSLIDAIQRALRQNLGAIESAQSVRLARAARDRARASLLPNLGARVTETRQKINLAAFGFAGLPGAEAFPTLVGPFNVFDARVGVTQAVLDLHALEDTREKSASLKAAQSSFDNTRDLVVLVAGNLYLRAVAAASAREAAQEQRAAAEALLTVATDRKKAGVVAGIDVLRAQVQLQRRTERGLLAGNQAEKARLDLARAIGLPLGQRFTLSDAMGFAPHPAMTLEVALQRAYEARADWKEAQYRVRAAEAARRAARGEALPSVSVSADYGEIGPSVSEARVTYTLNAAVHVPVFEGGRAQARVLEADALLQERRAEAEDLRARVRYDVEGAFLDLSSAAARVETARVGVDLAREQLLQAQDRFAAGVAGNIEVVQAQDALAASQDAYVSSVYDHNVAKATLARSLGIAEEAFVQFVKGQ